MFEEIYFTYTKPVPVSYVVAVPYVLTYEKGFKLF
jgi:hypothetical protein